MVKKRVCELFRYTVQTRHFSFSWQTRSIPTDHHNDWASKSSNHSKPICEYNQRVPWASSKRLKPHLIELPQAPQKSFPAHPCNVVTVCICQKYVTNVSKHCSMCNSDGVMPSSLGCQKVMDYPESSKTWI